MSRLKTVVSGSFNKFKLEIDECIDAFTELGVEVLEPAKGWQTTPRLQIIRSSFHPLPSELGLGVKQIEDRFLRAIGEADFLYVYSQNHYIGLSAAFEVGTATEKDREPEMPVYTAEPIADVLSEGNLERFHYLQSRLVVAGIADVVRIEQAKRE